MNTQDRFDELFARPTMNPIDSRMLPLVEAPAAAPAPAPVYREPQSLTLLKGDALVAYLKKASTVNLRKWLTARVGYELPADWERGHVLAVLTGLLVPLTAADKQRNFDTVVDNLVHAAKLSADPTGDVAHQAVLDRKAAYSAAGKVGAAGTAARRAAAGVQVGSKYSDDEVRLIRWMAKHGWNDKQVAAYFHDRTKPAMIWAIRTGVSYAKVIGEATTGPEAPASK